MAIYVVISFSPSLTEINDGNTLETQRSPAEYHLPTVDCQSPSVKHVFSRCLQLNFQSADVLGNCLNLLSWHTAQLCCACCAVVQDPPLLKTGRGQEWVTPAGGHSLSYTIL